MEALDHPLLCAHSHEGSLASKLDQVGLVLEDEVHCGVLSLLACLAFAVLLKQVLLLALVLMRPTELLSVRLGPSLL